MSDQTSMFNDDNKPTTPETPDTTTQNNGDPFSGLNTILSSIKNENGEQKYKDVETALRALSASQQFIEQLKTEKSTTAQQLEEANRRLQEMGNIEDFVKKISPPNTPQNTPATPKESTVSVDVVRQLLDQELTQRETARQAALNLEKVVDALAKEHGDNAAAYIKQRAQELSTTAQNLKELAMQNPTMALSLLQKNSKQPNNPSQSSVRQPLHPNTNLEPPKFEKGAARGGHSSKELVAMWRQSKEYTNKRLNVEN